MTDDAKMVPSPELYSRIASMQGWTDPNTPRELDVAAVDSILKRLPGAERSAFWGQFRGELKLFQNRSIEKAAKAADAEKGWQPLKKFGPQ